MIAAAARQNNPCNNPIEFLLVGFPNYTPFIGLRFFYDDDDGYGNTSVIPFSTLNKKVKNEYIFWQSLYRAFYQEGEDRWDRRAAAAS
jgi:hypothetical protein